MDVTAVLLAAAAAPAPGFFDAGIGRFLLSPGFGGTTALVGALVAYIAVRRQSGDTRTKMDADRTAAETRAAVEAEAARQQRWWETLTWVYDRAAAEQPSARLSTDLALDLFDRLLREAHTELEIATALGLVRQVLRNDTGKSEGP